MTALLLTIGVIWLGVWALIVLSTLAEAIFSSKKMKEHFYTVPSDTPQSWFVTCLWLIPLIALVGLLWPFLIVAGNRGYL